MSKSTKKKYPKDPWINPRIEIRDSPLQGKGMFAKDLITKGNVVVVWGTKEFYRTKEEAEEAAVNGKIFTQYDENFFVMSDTKTRGDDPTHYMNHSCDSNIWMKDEITLVARKDIHIGEEVTIDYALFESADDWVSPWECCCGSPLCRGKHTGKGWMMPDIQERYKGHFSPYNNKRIKALKNAEDFNNSVKD